MCVCERERERSILNINSRIAWIALKNKQRNKQKPQNKACIPKVTFIKVLTIFTSVKYQFVNQHDK